MYHYNTSNLLALFFALTLASFSQSSDLFISEYHEGSSNNKWIEIYNGTGQTVDLSAYSLLYEGNFSSQDPPGYGSELELSGQLENDDVFIIAHTGIDPSIANNVDEFWTKLSMTGDDPIALSKNGEVIDVIGYPYKKTDPENNSSFHWQIGDKLLDEARIIRKPSVSSPNTNWNLSSGAGVYENSEWIFTNVTLDHSDLGKHQMYKQIDPNVKSLRINEYYDKGFQGCNYPEIKVEVLDISEEIITNLTGILVIIELVDYDGIVIQRFNGELNGSEFIFSDIVFDFTGDLQIRANYNGLISDPKNVLILDKPLFKEIIIPQYVIGKDEHDISEKILPSWALVELSGLHPNTNYRMINGLSNVDNQDDLEQLQTNDNIFGGNIYYDSEKDQFDFSSEKPLLQKVDDGNCYADNVDLYSTYISDNEGKLKIWLSTSPIDSDPITVSFDKLWWVLELGFENNKGTIYKYQSENFSVPISFESSDSKDINAVGIVEYSSDLKAKNIISFWSDKSEDPSRPLSTAMVQDDEIIWQQKKLNDNCENEGYYKNLFVPFYQEVDGYHEINDLGEGWGGIKNTFNGLEGAWASFYPDNLSLTNVSETPSNITQIRVWDFFTKLEEKKFIDEDGIWGGVNTNDPRNNYDNRTNSIEPLIFKTPFLELTNFKRK